MTESASDHPHHEVEDISFAVVTVTSSRSLETDTSGKAIVECVEADGYEVTARDLVGDHQQAIASRVLALVERDDVDAIILTGGSGLSPEDVTIEAIRPQVEKEIPGFGELFRSKSFEDVGPHAILSRAFAGVTDSVPVFCLPGSEQAATFGTEELILPTIAHILGITRGH